MESKVIKQPPKSKPDHSKKYKEIPKEVKRKHPYSGRVGEKAQKMKKQFNVNVTLPIDEPAPKKKKKKSIIIEEQLPAEVVNKVNDAYFEVQFTDLRENSLEDDVDSKERISNHVDEIVAEESISDHVDEIAVEERNSDHVEERGCVDGIDDVRGDDNTAGNLVNVGEGEDDLPCFSTTISKNWRSAFTGLLTKSELSCLEDGEKLNDLIIDSALK